MQWNSLILRLCSADMTWAQTWKTRAFSGAEAEWYGIGLGSIEIAMHHTLHINGDAKATPLLQADSQSASDADGHDE